MPSIGELFVEIGTIGDSKELKQFVENTKEAVKQIDKQIQGNKRLLQYLKDLKEAQTQGEKALVKENFANEIKKQKMLDQIDVTEKQISGHKELAANVGKVVKGIGLFVGAVTGAAIALNKFTNDLVQSNQAMLNLTRTTDIAQSTFQKWGSIGKMLGVENADQQLASLNQRLFDLMLTGEGARGFQLAGINPVGQDAEGVLEQLRARVSGMNDTMATYLLQQMGLDPQMLHLLRMSRTEFEELGETVRKYQLTPEQSKQIQQMNIQLQIAGIRLQYLKDRAILAIMPAFTQFMQSVARVAEMLAKVGKEVGNFVVKWRGLIAGLVVGLSKLKPIQVFFTTLSESISTLITKIPIFGRAFAALGGIFAKVLLPLTALYLLLDDIAVYMQGGNSLIGEVIEWAKNSGGEIGAAFGKMFGGDVLGGLSDLGQTLIDILQDVLLSILRIIDILLGTKIKEGAKQNINFIRDVLGVKDENDFLKAIENAPQWVQKAYELSPKIGVPESFITPQMERSVSDNSTVNNTDNRSIAMTNYIQTSQPAFDIQNQLLYARNAMNSTFA